MQPRSYPMCFYVFEDSTSPQILLSYVTLERLGILEFKVPNLAATSQIEDFSVPTSPTPSGKGRLLKASPSVTTQGLSNKRKTTSLQLSFGNNSYIRGTECKVLNYPNKSTPASHCPPLPPQSHNAHQVSPQDTVVQGNFPLFHLCGQDIMALKQAFPNSL